MKFSGKVGNGSVKKLLDFGIDPDHRLDSGIVFRIRHYWEIRKVLNGHKSAAHTDSPDGSTGKTCLGGDTHSPSLTRIRRLCPRSSDSTVEICFPATAGDERTLRTPVQSAPIYDSSSSHISSATLTTCIYTIINFTRLSVVLVTGWPVTVDAER